jgi:hypothetical protein
LRSGSSRDLWADDASAGVRISSRVRAKPTRGSYLVCRLPAGFGLVFYPLCEAGGGLAKSNRGVRRGGVKYDKHMRSGVLIRTCWYSRSRKVHSAYELQQQ